MDQSVTSTDLAKIFGFNATPYLRKNTCIETDGEGDDRFAKVVCPVNVYDDLLKLNNVEFYGKNLLIEGENEDSGESTGENNDTNAEAAAGVTEPVWEWGRR